MADLSLHEVVCSIAEFISPLLSPDSDVIAWQAPGPWR
jgi:hypothetical protein